MLKLIFRVVVLCGWVIVPDILKELGVVTHEFAHNP